MEEIIVNIYKVKFHPINCMPTWIVYVDAPNNTLPDNLKRIRIIAAFDYAKSANDKAKDLNNKLNVYVN